MNVLVIEDEIITLSRIVYFLDKWGYSISTAENGSKGLEKFFAGSIDIVVTDWLMPEMDGPELVKSIRSSDKPFVYIIFLTSMGKIENVVKALSETGADDYLVKPFEPDVLRARLGVGKRTVRLERRLREYGHSLENIVKKQTRIIRKTQEETILRLLTALGARDKETGGHVKRIGLFSALLAEAALWPSDRIADIYLAAPMHDIGKIGISDLILRKKGRLTKTEFDIIKSHTVIGGEILKDSEFPMLQLAHEIALYHHERWDGKGYPVGLVREQIPESARIVAIVDVYDAISQGRIYRKAYAENKVFKSMREGKGSHFDPDLYDLFVNLIPEYKRIAKENP